MAHAPMARAATLPDAMRPPLPRRAAYEERSAAADGPARTQVPMRRNTADPCRPHAVAMAMLAAALAAAPAAAAAIHKCAGPGGTTYQDRPCGADTAPAAFDGATATLSVTPSPARGTTIVRREPPEKPPRAERAQRAKAPRTGDPSARRYLRTGMSEGEVIARVGPPDLTTGKGRRQARWTWMPAPGDPDTITVVLFDVGRVVEIERTVVKR